jgi:UrcA family protein
MKSLNLIHRSTLMGLALASAACLLASAAASAADRSETARGLTVRYADLNMSTIAGATTLYRRIQGAARLVCGDEGRALDDQRDWKICYHGAVSNAVSTVDSALLDSVYHQHNGEAPVTAMLGR